MDRTERVTLTNMCMISQDNRVLVQNKVNSDWNGITFPGGHVEKNESFADAVIREVQEETGLTIQSPQLCGIKNWTQEDGSRYMVLLYKTDRFKGELKSSEEGEVFWVPWDKLLTADTSLNMRDDMRDMLSVFLDEDLSEVYYERKNGAWTYALK